MNKKSLLVAVALVASSMLSCSGELTDNASPVTLVVTNAQNLRVIDIAPNTDPDCDENVGTINMQVIPKSDNATGNFVQVRVNRYRVSYQRTDGGSQVPAPFVRSMDTLIGVGGTSSLSAFTILEGDALNQAPFVALQPQNGGRDPQTLRPVIKLEVIVEIFGETLAGDNVYDATRFPLDFCYDCGGCQK
ncbi:MAG TPA: hypothetical protein VHW00_16215 [Thermoanaerobaculia bacterium]|nr:hypothetical protein [Thermoanaerobaculia bacterium]